IHYQQRGAGPFNQPVFLRLERGYQHGSGQVFGQITRCDADVVTAPAPFSEFVVGKSASRDSVNGLAPVLAVVGPKLKNQRLARTGRGLDNDVLSRSQSGDGFLLPEVRNGHLVQATELGKWLCERHARNIARKQPVLNRQKLVTVTGRRFTP